MMIQASTIETESRFGVAAKHRFFTQDGGSDRLLIILPGYGYTGEYPLLYFLRSAALELGWDVLTVQYGFQAAQTDTTAETMLYVQDDVEQAAQPVLARGYGRVCIAGKSLGTPLAVDLAGRITGAAVSLLLLTPVGGATTMVGTTRTLALIGTADERYQPDLAPDTAHLTWRVFDELNHSLEKPGDWRASLSALGEIIAACAAFLDQTAYG